MINPNQNLQQSSKIMLQKELERKYDKKQKNSYLQSLFKDVVKHDSLNPHIQIHILAVLAHQKSLFLHTLVEMLIERNDVKESSIQIAKTVESMIINNQVNIELINNDIKLHTKWLLKDDVISKLNSFKTLLPLIVLPKHVNNNTDSGYLTRNRDVLITGNRYFNNHDEDICLDVINKANQVNFRLAIPVTMHGKNTRDHIHAPKRYETNEEYNERLKAFNLFNLECYEAFHEMSEVGNSFYFNHKWDKRGRLYPEAYHLNPQGNDYAKACLEFRNQEIIENEIDFFNDNSPEVFTYGEWVQESEDKPILIFQLDKQDKLINSWTSIEEALEHLNISVTRTNINKIARVCDAQPIKNGNRTYTPRTFKSFKWQWA